MYPNGAPDYESYRESQTQAVQKVIRSWRAERVRRSRKRLLAVMATAVLTLFMG